VLVVVDGTEVSTGTVVSTLRFDRLISEAMTEPVTEAMPMIPAAMIGPHLVRLMRPAMCSLADSGELCPPSLSALTAISLSQADRWFIHIHDNQADGTGRTTHCARRFIWARWRPWNDQETDGPASPPLVSRLRLPSSRQR
jgi:hypothetical protein